MLDSLVAFGLSETNAVIRRGRITCCHARIKTGVGAIMETDDLYSRYHPTWSAIDGLGEIAWRGKAPRFPSILPCRKIGPRAKAQIDFRARHSCEMACCDSRAARTNTK